MKAFNRIFSVVAVAVILLFAVVNLILAADKTNNGRLYRVEISRLVREIEANGSADISECVYVTNIERYFIALITILTATPTKRSLQEL